MKQFLLERVENKERDVIYRMTTSCVCIILLLEHEPKVKRDINRFLCSNLRLRMKPDMGKCVCVCVFALYVIIVLNLIFISQVVLKLPVGCPILKVLSGIEVSFVY